MKTIWKLKWGEKEINTNNKNILLQAVHEQEGGENTKRSLALIHTFREVSLMTALFCRQSSTHLSVCGLIQTYQDENSRRMKVKWQTSWLGNSRVDKCVQNLTEKAERDKHLSSEPLKRKMYFGWESREAGGVSFRYVSTFYFI